jgi:hypothetical protein
MDEAPAAEPDFTQIPLLERCVDKVRPSRCNTELFNAPADNTIIPIFYRTGKPVYQPTQISLSSSQKPQEMTTHSSDRI